MSTSRLLEERLTKIDYICLMKSIKKHGMGDDYDPRKVAMMKALEAKIKKAKGTPAAKPLVEQYRKLTGTK